MPSSSPSRQPVRARWVLFALGALAAVSALAWVTRAVLSLEREQGLARAERDQAERVRLALWRLDSWMAPRLAAEAARPYFHYLALYPPRRAYDQHLQPIGAGEVLTPSPLLAFEDDVVRLHVQVDAHGNISSPQVPETWWSGQQIDGQFSGVRREDARQLLQRARLELGGVPLVQQVEEILYCQTLVMAVDPQSEAPFVSDLLSKLSPRVGGGGGRQGADAAEVMLALGRYSQGDLLPGVGGALTAATAGLGETSLEWRERLAVASEPAVDPASPMAKAVLEAAPASATEPTAERRTSEVQAAQDPSGTLASRAADASGSKESHHAGSDAARPRDGSSAVRARAAEKAPARAAADTAQIAGSELVADASPPGAARRPPGPDGSQDQAQGSSGDGAVSPPPESAVPADRAAVDVRRVLAATVLPDRSEPSGSLVAEWPKDSSGAQTSHGTGGGAQPASSMAREDAAARTAAAIAPQVAGGPVRSLSPSRTRSQSPPQSPPQSLSQSGLFETDYAKRLIQLNVAQEVGQSQSQWSVPPVDTDVAGAPMERAVEVGPFVPLWIAHEGGEPALYYFRRVALGGTELAQGFLVDWSTLCGRLREQIADLLPAAVIRPVRIAADEGGAGSRILGLDDVAAPAGREIDGDTRLATIPARLVPGPCSAPVVALGLTPARATLGTAWLALLAAIVAAGVSLHATAADAARRARFAGAVTHELRTPLTTFQLYTDMLVDGMVPEERRGEYLETLRNESQRLGHLVENVLSYARIEQGRHAGRKETLALNDLLARVLQPLERRAESAGLRLRVEAPVEDGERTITTDPESVERILFNLVDNAVKYGAPSAGAAPPKASSDESPASTSLGMSLGDAEATEAPRELVLRVDADAEGVRLSVVDHGPGVPKAQQARLFQPFERGSDDHTQQQRGLGLGLALSRELARILGGDLLHQPTPGGGATFTLLLGGTSAEFAPSDRT